MKQAEQAAAVPQQRTAPPETSTATTTART
jgi:hypothetical protein